MWYAALHDPGVQRLLAYLHGVVLPSAAPPRTPASLPDHLWHLVWNADPTEIDPRADSVYLAHRAVTTSDPEALGWAVTTLPSEALEAAARMRGVPAQAAAWARASRGHEHGDAHA